MIKQVVKQIWTLRLSNIWLWAELLIVSVCMWYIVDYLYVTIRLYFMPLGFDIEHTYQVRIHTLFPDSDQYDPAESEEERMITNFLTITERIKTYPGMEAVCISDQMTPYALGYKSGMKHIDTIDVHGNIQTVSPEYFEVFKVRSKSGTIQTLAETAKQPHTYFISLEGEKRFLEQGIDPLHQPIRDWGQAEATNIVRGITSEFRKHRFENYYPDYFQIVSPSTLFEWYNTGTVISFRITPEADTPDFLYQFRQAMTNQLRIGNLYLLDVSSYNDSRDSFYQTTGLINDLKTRLAVLFFLLINIFMGITGTFWVRTQQRRAELGVRMALGATKRTVQMATIGEGILLFAFIIIPASFLAWHLQSTERLADDRIPVTIGRFIVVISVVYSSITGMIATGIYFPVKQILKIKPADVLHEE